uniref:Uronyl 2-sulfotransferase n=1 Tax=Eptatretus burgeri TaxID=7764 RepID=A0A8C4RA49_EPTBU
MSSRMLSVRKLGVRSFVAFLTVLIFLSTARLVLHTSNGSSVLFLDQLYGKFYSSDSAFSQNNKASHHAKHWKNSVVHVKSPDGWPVTVLVQGKLGQVWQMSGQRVVLIAKDLPFPSQVFYNRVGKCGSRTLVQLMRILAEKNAFTFATSNVHNKTRLHHVEQEELMKNISALKKPFLYTRHVHFLDFNRFGMEQPTYINIIRDPISRFLSSYFFRRFGDRRNEQSHIVRTPNMKMEERLLSIDKCILQSFPECNNPKIFYIIPYFCGQDPRCREPGIWALTQAKENVMRNYLLVGILEELEDTLLLLQRLLPHYFKNAASIYNDPAYLMLGNDTVTVKKASPSLPALQVLHERMRWEYDFYYFARDQFNLMKHKMGLKGAAQPNDAVNEMSFSHYQEPETKSKESITRSNQRRVQILVEEEEEDNNNEKKRNTGLRTEDFGRGEDDPGGYIDDEIKDLISKETPKNILDVESGRHDEYSEDEEMVKKEEPHGIQNNVDTDVTHWLKDDSQQ